MRALQQTDAPICLDGFAPTGDGPGDWERFKDAKACYNECRISLAEAQDGLCAYCEINVRFPKNSEPKYWDFQIEHIWPKSIKTECVFAWSNFVGCCQGGTSGGHSPDSGHKAAKGQRNTCGQSKGEGSPLSLLNPYQDLYPSDIVFEYDTLGIPRVHPRIRAEISPKAENSLKQLNLADSRLNRLRKTVIDELSDRVLDLCETIVDLDKAMTLLWGDIRASFAHMGVPEFISVYRDFFSKGSDHGQNSAEGPKQR